MNDPGQPSPPQRLLRTAKGKRPQYFADPDVDRLLAIVVSLIGEVAVLRDRLDTVERLLETGELITRNAIEEFAPTPFAQAARDAWRAEYLERVFRVIQSEREELTQGRAVDLDKVIDDFAAGRI